MRTMLALPAVLALTLAADAQERRRPDGPPLDPAGPTRLLVDPAVRRELNLTEEQLKKVQEAIQKAVADALSPEQAKRLKQIELQTRGLEAFRDEAVHKALELTAEQKEKLASIIREGSENLRGLFAGGRPTDREEAMKKLEEARKQAQAKVEAVLTEAQQKVWKEMVGAPIEIRRFFPGAPPAPPRRPRPDNNQ